MKLHISQPNLSALLSDVGPAIASKGVLPILSHVLLETRGDSLQATGNNHELTLSSKAQCQSERDEGVTIEYAKLSKIVSSLQSTQDISLAMGHQRVVLKSGRSRFTLQTLSADDFPLPVPATEDEKSLTVDGKAFANLIKSVFFSVAIQDVRFYLCGVLLELTKDGLIATATDGHRLASASMPLDHGLDPAQYIIPQQTVAALLKMCDGEVKLSLFRNQLQLEANNRLAVSKLIDGRYPDYGRVIPDQERHQGRIAVYRGALQEALGRVAILSNEKHKGISLSVADSASLVLETVNPEGGEAREEIEIIDGEAHVCRVGLCYEYLMDALKATDAEQVILHYGDGATPLRVEPAKDNPPVWIIMPMLI